MSKDRGWYIEPCKKCGVLHITELPNGAMFTCLCPIPSVPDAVITPMSKPPTNTEENEKVDSTSSDPSPLRIRPNLDVGE
ncbi:hypothetical protein LCGC14_2263040 [marine sediment metagenome]|uniref:Uncharacterized protein n=1 Tax=marine sediment metagenome TaxID=412755 RepID=A0A0F9CZB9_9ZZZZ